MLLIVVFVVIPIGYAVTVSFLDFNLTRASTERAFIGLRNYERSLASAQFWAAVPRTIYVALGRVVLTTLLGLGVALLLNRKFGGRGTLQPVMLLPWMIAPAVAGVVWQMIFNAKYGVFNAIVVGLGLSDRYQPWLSNPDFALNVIIMIEVWRAVPFAALFLLAARQTIPERQYSAALMDGANAFRQFFYITLPSLARPLLILVLVETLWSLQVFDTLFVLTQGGPGQKTTTLPYLVFSQAFESLDLGRGAATGILLCILIALTVALLAGLAVLPGRLRRVFRRSATLSSEVGERLMTRWTPPPRRTRTPGQRELAARFTRLGWALLISGTGMLVVLWSVAPIAWVAIVSVQPLVNVTSVPPVIDWTAISFTEYADILTDETFLLAAGNSLVVALATTALCLVVGSLSAYALARTRLPHGGTFLGVVLGTRMVPAVILLVPLFLVVRGLRIMDTQVALILVYTAFFLPYAIWMLRNFFLEVQPSLEAAALVDGSTRIGALFRIFMPVAGPGIAVTGLFCFILVWNELLFGLVLTTRAAKTLPVKIAELRGLWDLPLNTMAAAAILAALPLILVSLLVSRQIVHGLTSGAAKG